MERESRVITLLTECDAAPPCPPVMLCDQKSGGWDWPLNMAAGFFYCFVNLMV